MIFQVNFRNNRNITIHIDDTLTSTTTIEVPVKEIIELLHDIADDFDMLKPRDKKDLQFAIDRIQEEYNGCEASNN